MNPVRSNLIITLITKAMQNSTIVNPVRNHARARSAPEGPLGRAVSNGVKKGLNNNTTVAHGDLLLTG